VRIDQHAARFLVFPCRSLHRMVRIRGTTRFPPIGFTG
jgi:hypothetical protein